MLNESLVIARKEAVDALRDVRWIVASLFYALMGPLVVGLVSMTLAGAGRPGSRAAVLVNMMSVFTLVAAFVGGMNVAMDAVAGERERHSLLPLLLNPVSRRDLVLGKWLAVSLFAVAGIGLNLLGFALVCRTANLHVNVRWQALSPILAFGILPLPLLAAAAQLLISTVCRGVKEAQTWLSMIVFLPMSIGMLFAFVPAARRAWCGILPVVGQQLQLELLLNGKQVQLLQPIALGCTTVILALLVLLVAANRLGRDEIIYGN